MSMVIQSSSCCERITNFASAAASGLTEAASKVAEFVKPHFETLKAFIQEHKQGCLIAGAVVIAGSLLAIFARICCCGETSEEEELPPASNSGSRRRLEVEAERVPPQAVEEARPPKPTTQEFRAVQALSQDLQRRVLALEAAQSRVLEPEGI